MVQKSCRRPRADQSRTRQPLMKDQNTMPTSAIIQTQNLGYPRIGAKRELKRAVEAFWQGRISEEAMHAEATRLRAQHWQKQREAGIDLIPSNDFSFYDQA